MVIADQNRPVLTSARDTVGDDFAAVFDARARGGAAKDIGTSIERTGQQPMDGVVARRPPPHRAPLRTMDSGRQVDPLLAQPQDELAHAADLTKFVDTSDSASRMRRSGSCSRRSSAPRR